MVLITILGWSFQILDIICPGLIVLNQIVAYTICTFGILYYMISIGLFSARFAPILRRKYGKAKTLRVWEIFVSVGKYRLLNF